MTDVTDQTTETQWDPLQYTFSFLPLFFNKILVLEALCVGCACVCVCMCVCVWERRRQRDREQKEREREYELGERESLGERYNKHCHWLEKVCFIPVFHICRIIWGFPKKNPVKRWSETLLFLLSKWELQSRQYLFGGV